MAKQAERGTKRACDACGSKFYDLNRDPIVCPICGAEQELEAVAKAIKPGEEDTDEITDDDASGDSPVAEFISLEEAEADEAEIEDDEDLAGIETDEVEISADDDEDAFLEDDEDGETDVTGIIGSPVKKREES